MDQDLKLEDIDESIRSDVYTQDYSKETPIDGVKISPIKNFVGEEGDFEEVLRVDEKGELVGFPGFKIAQINRTLSFPGTVKAWHLHLGQEEIWHATPDSHLIVGLWDVRKDSPTRGKMMRIVAGGGQSQLIYIPKGVAHGYSNVSGNPATLLYIVNRNFNTENPDEKRIHWDTQGADFWEVKRD